MIVSACFVWKYDATLLDKSDSLPLKSTRKIVSNRTVSESDDSIASALI